MKINCISRGQLYFFFLHLWPTNWIKNQNKNQLWSSCVKYFRKRHTHWMQEMKMPNQSSNARLEFIKFVATLRAEKLESERGSEWGSERVREFVVYYWWLPLTFGRWGLAARLVKWLHALHNTLTHTQTDTHTYTRTHTHWTGVGERVKHLAAGRKVKAKAKAKDKCEDWCSKALAQAKNSQASP